MDEPQERDPAASMSLLNRVIADSLDPGYRKQHDRDMRREDKSWHKVLWLVWVFVLSVALTWVAVVSARTLHAEAVEKPSAASELEQQVENSAATVARLQEENESLEQQIGELDPATESPLVDASLATVAATAKVIGPGVTVSITDRFGGGTPLIRDTDIRTLLNALWAGGAEAMAIDGLRIGPQTSVRTAGSSILVNLTPLTSPYVIEAIGDPDRLGTALSKGVAASAVRNLEDTLGMTITTTASTRLVLSPLPASTLWYAVPSETEEQSSEGEGGQ